MGYPVVLLRDEHQVDTCLRDFYAEAFDWKFGADDVYSTRTPPTEVPGGVTYAVFRDPAGNRIGLIKG